MRTLEEIDADIAEKSRARVEELKLDPVCDVMSSHDIMTLQCEARFGEKYREMHSILQDVETFIYNTGDCQLQMRIAARLKAL